MNYKAHDLAKKLLSLPNYFVAINGLNETYSDLEIIEVDYNSNKLSSLDSEEFEEEMYILYENFNEDGTEFPLIIINQLRFNI